MSLKMILLSFSENVFPRAIDIQAPRRFSCNIKDKRLNCIIHYYQETEHLHEQQNLVAMTML